MGRRRVHVKACGSEPARREPARLKTPAGLAALQLHLAGRAGLAAASAQGRPLLAASHQSRGTIGAARDCPEWSLSSAAACSSGSSPVRPVAAGIGGPQGLPAEQLAAATGRSPWHHCPDELAGCVLGRRQAQHQRNGARGPLCERHEKA